MDETKLEVRKVVAQVLVEDLCDQGRSREDAVYLVRRRWHDLGIDETERFWTSLEKES